MSEEQETLPEIQSRRKGTVPVLRVPITFEGEELIFHVKRLSRPKQFRYLSKLMALPKAELQAMQDNLGTEGYIPNLTQDEAIILFDAQLDLLKWCLVQTPDGPVTEDYIEDLEGPIMDELLKAINPPTTELKKK